MSAGKKRRGPVGPGYMPKGGRLAAVEHNRRWSEDVGASAAVDDATLGAAGTTGDGSGIVPGGAAARERGGSHRAHVQPVTVGPAPIPAPLGIVLLVGLLGGALATLAVWVAELVL